MSETSVHKVLVSACLLGQPVRYDGQSKGIVSDWLRELGAEGRALAFCPGWRAVCRPAPACRTARRAGGDRGWTGCDGRVRSRRPAGAATLPGSGHSLRPAEGGEPLLRQHRIYNFEGVSVSGEGMTTALLRCHGIRVFSEDQLPELASALALAACGSA